MITFVYDVLFGYIMLSIIDGKSTKVTKGGEPVHSGFRYACLRCLRVHHLPYWHPNQLWPMKTQLGGYRIIYKMIIMKIKLSMVVIHQKPNKGRNGRFQNKYRADFARKSTDKPAKIFAVIRINGLFTQMVSNKENKNPVIQVDYNGWH